MIKEVENENILWLETKDNAFALLFVTYKEGDKESYEKAQASSILESEIRVERIVDTDKEDILGLDLHIRQIPEFLGRHFVGNVELYGLKTRLIFRAFKPSKNGWVQIPPPEEFFDG